jgi:hypothetical protein
MNRRTFFAAVASVVLGRPRRVGLTTLFYGRSGESLVPPYRLMKVMNVLRIPNLHRTMLLPKRVVWSGRLVNDSPG